MSIEGSGDQEPTILHTLDKDRLRASTSEIIQSVPPDDNDEFVSDKFLDEAERRFMRVLFEEQDQHPPEQPDT